jgi:hypothetical protein
MFRFELDSIYLASIMTNNRNEIEQPYQRLQKILQGAFAGPPTPLKDIPKKSGVTRAPKAQGDQPPRKRRQRKNRAA